MTNTPTEKPLRRCAVFLLAATLAGCAVLEDQEAQNDFDAAREHYRATLEAQQTELDQIPIPGQRIDVPEYEAWLYRPYRASYRKQGFRETLRRIVPALPITYALPAGYNPTVSSTPDATTVADHLAAVMLQANAGYTLHSGVLLITPMTTREYALPIFGGNNIVNVASNNLGRARATGGFENTVSTQLSVENDIRQLVQTTLGIPVCAQTTDATQELAPPITHTTYNPRECYSISPAGNLLTITARPQRLARFDPAYNAWLTTVTRQASIKITILRLDVTDLAQHQVDLSLLRNASIALNLSNVTKNLVDSQIEAAGSVLSIRANDPDSDWYSSELILQALATLGNVAIDDTKEMLVYNNRLVTLRNYRVHRYVEEVTIQQTNAGGTSLSTPTVEIGEIETGQAINILPTLTGDRIALHIVINQAQIDQFDTYQIAGSSGVLPIDSGEDSIFDVTLRHGETLLLASTHRQALDMQSDRSGLLPIWPFNRITGNAARSAKRLTQTLFLIQGSFKKT